MTTLTRESDALNGLSSTWQTRSLRSFALGSELSATRRSCLLDQTSSDSPIIYDEFLISGLDEVRQYGPIPGERMLLKRPTYGDFITRVSGSSLRDLSWHSVFEDLSEETMEIRFGFI